MIRTKPLNNQDRVKDTPDDNIIYANEYTDITTHRGGRTFKLNVIYRFGKMQDEKRRNRHSDDDDAGSMDMGF